MPSGSSRIELDSTSQGNSAPPSPANRSDPQSQLRSLIASSSNASVMSNLSNDSSEGPLETSSGAPLPGRRPVFRWTSTAAHSELPPTAHHNPEYASGATPSSPIPIIKITPSSAWDEIRPPPGLDSVPLEDIQTSKDQSAHTLSNHSNHPSTSSASSSSNSMSSLNEKVVRFDEDLDNAPLLPPNTHDATIASQPGRCSTDDILIPHQRHYRRIRPASCLRLPPRIKPWLPMFAWFGTTIGFFIVIAFWRSELFQGS